MGGHSSSQKNIPIASVVPVPAGPKILANNAMV